PPPAPAPTGVTLTSRGWADTVTGGSGDDTLIASKSGGEKLTGGAGADTFVFSGVPLSPSHIKDFQPGVDHLDLSALLARYAGSDPIGDRWLSLATDGKGGTKVMVDVDGRTGPASMKVITILDGVAPAGLTASQLLTHAAGHASAPLD